MDDTLIVSIIERGCKTLKQTGHLVRRNSFMAFVKPPQIICQRWSLQILHYNIGMAVCGIKIEDLHNIGMTQPRHDSGFTMKARKQIGVLFNITMQKLDSNRAFKGEV